MLRRQVRRRIDEILVILKVTGLHQTKASSDVRLMQACTRQAPHKLHGLYRHLSGFAVEIRRQSNVPALKHFPEDDDSCACIIHIPGKG